MSGIIHEAVKPISWLLGTWKSTSARGSYPTMNDFEYTEVIEFTSVGQPMLNYISTSTHPEKPITMHQERGFLRIKPGTNELSFLVSHNFGLTSIEEGVCNTETKEIHLKSTNVSRSSFAKPPKVLSFERKFRLLEPNALEIILFMETENTPLTQHLKAVYKKV